MSNVTFDETVEIEIQGKTHYANLTVQAEIGSDGIGSYEYWGQRCFDGGHACVDEFNYKIESVENEDAEKVEITDAIRDIIESAVQVKEDDICAKALQQAADNYEPERDYEDEELIGREEM